MPNNYHNESENLYLQVVGSFNRAEELGFLTDAGVAAADTKAGLKAFIDSVVVHNDQENWKSLLKRAVDSSGIADSDIAGLTTVAGLIALLPVTTSSQLVLE